MTSSVNDSLQERLGEELGLLPGRISRTFFLLATLDAQASLVKSDLQNNRIRLLENLSNNSSSSDLTISSSQQLSALRQLHQVQHQLLADKLFVDQKASEWLSRAKNVVNRFNQESRRGFKQSSGFHPPNFDLAISRRSLDLSQPEASIDDRHGTRFRKSLFDECAEYSSNSFGPYGLRPSDSSNSAVGSNFKRRRVLGYDDFVLPPGRPPHRRLGKYSLTIPH